MSISIYTNIIKCDNMCFFKQCGGSFMIKKYVLPMVSVCALLSSSVFASPVLMSSDWANEACQEWNNEKVLTDSLAENWIKNDKDRGYKVMQIYRSDCANSGKIELTIANKNGKAVCVYGGVVKHASVDTDVDYTMWADTKRWKEMGAGDYGPMKAMMFGRLNFAGPKVEAMGNMGPFEKFLLLAGKVDSTADTCPN